MVGVRLRVVVMHLANRSFVKPLIWRFNSHSFCVRLVYILLCKYSIHSSTRTTWTDSNRARPNPFTLRVNNEWILTNPTTFGSGVGPFNRPTRPNRQNITLKFTIFTQLNPQPDQIPLNPTIYWIGFEPKFL